MDTKWNSTGPDEGLEQLVAGEVREALKGVEDAPGVAKVRVSGKTCGRLRAAAGLAALVLGVSLVLGSLGQTAGRLASGVDSGSFGSGWWSTDWQETPAFRQEVAQRLRAFLAMATGSDLEWWDTASGDTYVVSSAGITWYEWGSTDTATERYSNPERGGARRLLCRGQESPLPGPGIGGGLLLQQCSSEYDPLLQLGRAGGLQLSADLPERYSHHHQGWRASGRLRRWIFYRGFPVGRPRL